MANKPRRVRIGSLGALRVDGSADGPTVVIFHGFGADMNDLAPLASALNAPKGTNFVFPNGHLTIPLGGHMEGRGWFPISISELEKSMSEGQPIDLSTIVPPGLKRARESALELIEELKTPANRLILGGFSQGGMVATEVALRLSTPPAGLAILSGTLLNAQVWAELAAKHKGAYFFQSHGVRDTVLSYAMAVKLEALLKNAGWIGQLQGFEGGHEIPPQVLINLGTFIRKRLA
jgi:phospholipase/carboxylesterase